MKVQNSSIKSLLLCVPAALFLAAGASAADVAGSAFNFLRMDAGAAGIALGGAATGRPTDAYAVFYNPALNYASGREGFISAGLSYSAWVEGITYQDAVIGGRSGKNAYGIAYRSLNYGNIGGYDAAGTRTDNYTAGAYILGLDFSRELSNGLVAGVAVKTAAETIDSAVSRAFLFDFGLFYKPFAHKLEKFTFGLALKNVGSSVRFDSENESLPMLWAAGAAYKPFAGKELALMLDCVIPNSGKPELRAGVEYSPFKGIVLRAGYSGSDAGSGLRAGAGVVFYDISLDYALLPMGDFGLTQHLGINLKFDMAGFRRKPAAPPAPVITPKPAEQSAAQPVVEPPLPVVEPAPAVAPQPAEEPAVAPVEEPVLPAVESAPAVAPQPAAELKVTGIKMGKGISGREPQEILKAFELKAGRVYCWTAVKAAPAPVKIKHVWYANGKKVLTVKLPVKPLANASWRTWSTTKVYWGEWKVEVTDENGTVLDSISFRVGKR